MSQLSTASVTLVTSCRDLSQKQAGFISSGGPEPGNRDAVEKFARQFRKDFGIEVPWKTMRRLITQVRRKERRNGWGDTTPKTARATQFSDKRAPVFRTGNHVALFRFRRSP